MSCAHQAQTTPITAPAVITGMDGGRIVSIAITATAGSSSQPLMVKCEASACIA